MKQNHCQFLEDVIKSAIDFAETNNALLMYSKPFKKKNKFTYGTTPIEEDNIYYFVDKTNNVKSDNDPICLFWFYQFDINNIILHIETPGIGLGLNIRDDLNILPIYNESMMKNLKSLSGSLDNKIGFFFEVMWNGENFLRICFGTP